ncbi:DUF5683 domain-containing protein [Ichthyenterobacterium sp. W332]|uniref:DUF5683 domain-containing protein n=1 Tax=Microcosmobacter mediterraneus TaxID=3075607 RepID=A0ABU2YGC1_9FLAO|nr:DUF5683 domain-containing protein [Ichthyenterobacterium sp. W332]MDT0557208.1 DUF5683 domain-containing protein [Ichthyenterobacterium sp. W332]
MLSINFGFTQNKKDSISVKTDNDLIIIKDTIARGPIDPLRPSKAAFFSAILPGLGQAYNKKYWKIPIVYAAIGTGVYFYINNNNQFKRYRSAFKSRLAGFNTDEFWGVDIDGNPLASPRVSNDGLQRAQEQFRKNKELSLLITIGLYALNIIDANVDAHLLQYNVDDNLAIRPHYQYNELENSSDVGLTLNFKF